MKRVLHLLLFVCASAMATPGAALAQQPPIDRIFIIAMENHESSDIVGSPAAPYLNSLIAEYGLAANYYALVHPSLPNYMALTSGNPAFQINCDDCRSDRPNLADSIEASGRTWTAYMEGMTGTCGLANEGLYVVKHNPFVHYRNISSNPARCANIVPFDRFASDLASGTLANFVWITPDLCHDMHDCDLTVGDAWLRSVVPGIIKSPAFVNALLLIWWDEGTTSAIGGGQVPLVVVSPRTPPGFRSTSPAGHYDALRTIEDLWGLPHLGESANARPLSEFFNLLQKPGFEEYGSASLGAPGWISDTPVRQTAAVSEAAQPRSGKRNGACRTLAYLDCGMVQDLIAPATGSYTLTFFANTDRPGGLIGADVNRSLAATANVEIRGAGTYGAPYVMRFNASEGDRITVWMYSPARPGYLVIDDVSLVATPRAVAPPPSNPGGTPGWIAQDIGAVGLNGTAALEGGTWTVSGAGGAAVWGTADAFHFVHQPLAGDGQVTVRVDGVQNTTPFAKAGVMIRDGAAPNAANVVLSIRPTGDLEFMQRSATGGATSFLATARTPPPYWVRLARTGTTIAASISSDGLMWIPVGATSVNMPNSVSAGLIVTSNHSNQLNTSRFQGLSLLPAPWSNRDIGGVGVIGHADQASGAFAIAGGGPTGVWGASDTFHFVHRSLTGDGEIVARVRSIEHTNTFAKVGVMMRDGLGAGAANVVLDIRPTDDVEFMQRKVAAGPTTFYATAKVPPPGWLRLVRAGGVISASVSHDGTTWSTIGSTPAAMSATIQVGLVVTSVDGARLNNAVIDNVTVR